MDTTYHIPVMLQQCIEGLNIKPDGVYADVTFGGGGHSRAILKQLGDNGKLYAFDRDACSKCNLIKDSRFTFIEDNYSNLKSNLHMYREIKIDGILADLGVSSYQIDEPLRGFSTRFDGTLDLRMDTKQAFSALNLVNEYAEEALVRVFKDYGELKNAHRIASSIIRQREIKPLETTFELKNTLRHLTPERTENKFYAMVFQALRIEVNNELDSLRSMLLQTLECLKEGGRLVVLSYHSLEDRLVKNFLRSGNLEGEEEKDFFGNKLTPFEVITRKPVTASDEEVEQNPRARSAKLRIGQKRQ
ncbi:MAG: 16S rRNA (cytosine(1402)-N(4))-methyltransferase RsmH [Bacteroidales bacterium]|jgi:16S rRNA (cytosine1402-N4)-methyltransferase|nr:16S rRNA (cytosine(1402)-N(4))-methyltransferase RsmH [Bacteroidales bacterium]